MEGPGWWWGGGRGPARATCKAGLAGWQLRVGGYCGWLLALGELSVRVWGH